MTGIEGIHETIESSVIHLIKEVGRIDGDVSSLVNKYNSMAIQVAVMQVKLLLLATGAGSLFGGLVAFFYSTISKSP